MPGGSMVYRRIRYSRTGNGGRPIHVTPCELWPGRLVALSCAENSHANPHPTAHVDRRSLSPESLVAYPCRRSWPALRLLLNNESGGYKGRLSSAWQASVRAKMFRMRGLRHLDQQVAKMIVLVSTAIHGKICEALSWARAPLQTISPGTCSAGSATVPVRLVQRDLTVSFLAIL